MSKWLNTKIRIWKVDKIERPCHKLKFCPYGQLVEEFPCHNEAAEYAKKHNRYVVFVEKNKSRPEGAWTKCKKETKNSVPDLNWAVGKVKEPYSCKVFGHDCPVYYHAESIAEEVK